MRIPPLSGRGRGHARSAAPTRDRRQQREPPAPAPVRASAPVSARLQTRLQTRFRPRLRKAGPARSPFPAGQPRRPRPHRAETREPPGGKGPRRAFPLRKPSGKQGFHDGPEAVAEAGRPGKGRARLRKKGMAARARPARGSPSGTWAGSRRRKARGRPPSRSRRRAARRRSASRRGYGRRRKRTCGGWPGP